jgi:hypothetical protein
MFFIFVSIICSLSWSIPYVAGVMAMGWQVKPNISGPEMVNLLITTASTNSQGYKIIDPVGFINKVRQMKYSSNLSPQSTNKIANN